VVDDRTYRGTVAVRLGPVALALAGQARLEEIDHAGLRARVRTRGEDTKGRGGSDATFDFRLESSGAGTRVLIHSEVTLSGAIAQYGRGAGMIQSVAAQLLERFGEALKAQIAAQGAGAPAAAPIPGLTVLGKAAWDTLTRGSGK
jgi:carbon monoxide dehydrogenase subunit G